LSNWIRLFVAPHGRTGRRTFWHGLIVILFVNMALTSGLGAIALKTLGDQAARTSQPLVLLPLLTLYPSVCVISKRLRSLGRPLWLQAPSRILLAVGLVALGASSWRPEPWLGALFALTFPLGLLGELALVVWLGVASPVVTRD
jgi:uncharacterized membrane protein YhaH (DUF805 family)